MTFRAHWLLLAAAGLSLAAPSKSAHSAGLNYGTSWENYSPSSPPKPAEKKQPEKSEEDTKESRVSDRFDFTPYAAVSVGHDSNFDEDIDEIGSYFQRYDLGLSLTYDHDGTFVELETYGTIYDLMELAVPDRWEYNIDLDGRIDLTKRKEFLFGFERIHDELTDPQTINNEAYAGLRWKGPTRTFRFIGSVEHEINLTPDTDFGSASADEFDYVKLTGDAKYQIWTQSQLSPFFRAKVSTLDFPGQNSGFINRNGTDVALIGGATVKISDKLEADIGGRYNVRHLDDVLIPKHSNGFVELDLKWKPSDKFTLRATVERELDEPGAELSVVADVTEYELSAEWKPEKKIKLEVKGSFEKEEEIGQDETEREWALGAAGFYSITDHLTLFTKMAHYWNEEEETGFPVEKYKRFEIRAGVETNF